jgi:hypothetical protein
MAFATSVTSARVGSGLLTIDSSIWVAVITGFRSSWHGGKMFLSQGDAGNIGFYSQVPLAIMMPSDTSIISSICARLTALYLGYHKGFVASLAASSRKARISSAG